MTHKCAKITGVNLESKMLAFILIDSKTGEQKTGEKEQNVPFTHVDEAINTHDCVGEECWWNVAANMLEKF